MKLNLGAGMQQIAGWTTVDLDPDMHPDIVGDIEHLPFEDNSIDEIYASHCLEHVPYDSPALSEWFRVLKRGAVCTVIVPDIIQVYYLWKHGAKWGPYNLIIDWDYINATAFGAHILKGVPELNFGDLGHTHRQIFIFDMLTQQMLKAGFDEVREVTYCTIRASSMGETMVQGRKFEGHASCYTEQPYCIQRNQ